MKKNLILLLLLSAALNAVAQPGDPKYTEVWTPVPKVITPGKTNADPPADAIVLLGGNKDSTNWKHMTDKPFNWKLEDNVFTVNPSAGDIQSKQSFGDCQLHIEWRAPSVVKGEGQMRGNSGIFLMGRYELQVLDSYNNTTYSNGQAGSIYKQHIPLVNANRKPGEWQTYDIIFTAPKFDDEGSLKSPARITVFHNGILIQNNVEIQGTSAYIGQPKYRKHLPKEPIVLQDHGDLVSYRNIWIREL